MAPIVDSSSRAGMHSEAVSPRLRFRSASGRAVKSRWEKKGVPGVRPKVGEGTTERYPLGVRRLALAALAALIVPLAPASAADGRVTMAGVTFHPPEVRVSAGGTVTWVNDDSMAHQVAADDGSFASSPTCEPSTVAGCMRPGDTFTHRFPAAGRVPYHCRLHGSPGKGMTGVVVVG